MDKFESLKLFVRTAQLGSFTATAAELNLSQGAVSKKIAWLENRIGFRLFHRNSRKIQLTEQGKQYLRYGERLLDEMAHTESRLKGELSEVKGELKLSVPSAMATQLLAKPVSRFMSQHPEIRFNVSVNDRKVDLIESDIDIAIRASVLEDSGYKARFLLNNEAVYFASPDYLEKHGVPDSAEDLVAHQCLAYSLVARTQSWILRDKKSSQQVNIQTHFASDSPEMLLQMALAGHGIAALPNWMIQQYLEEDRLVRVLSQYHAIKLPMYAVFKADEYQPYRVRAFIDYLVEYFQSLPEGIWARGAIAVHKVDTSGVNVYSDPAVY